MDVIFELGTVKNIRCVEFKNDFPVASLRSFQRNSEFLDYNKKLNIIGNDDNVIYQLS